jgi:hypothetical protein
MAITDDPVRSLRAKILSLTRRMVAMIELRWSSVDATVVFEERFDCDEN